MKDYIVFTVGSNYYALDVSHVERIIQIPSITIIPNSHSFVDGMMSYENRVLKVVNFRKMIGINSYEKETQEFFLQVKNDLFQWIKTLSESVELQNDFCLTTNFHTSQLGKWFDSYNTHDVEILSIIKVLRPLYTKLFEIANEALILRTTDLKASLDLIKYDINELFPSIISELEKMIDLSEAIAQQRQKLLIYQENNSFAIKVDMIQDIVSIQDSMLKEIDRSTKLPSCLEIEGVVEIGERLVNVIKTVELPTRGGV